MTTESPRYSDLRSVLGVLSDAGFDVDPIDVADACWLAAVLPPPPETRPAMETAEAAAPHSLPPEPPLGSDSPSLRAVPRRAGGPATRQAARLYARAEAEGGALVLLPDAPALPDKLALGRALRPLRRRVDSGTRMEVDLVATVNLTAVRRLAWDAAPLVPALRPARTRWLDAVLLVDRSQTMAVWRRTVEEWTQLLHQLGAFRDIRVWHLVGGSEGPALVSPCDGPVHPGVLHGVAELADPNGRRLVLIASDCIGPLWSTAAMVRFLEAQAAAGPLAIVQILPPHMWRRTALARSSTFALSASAPGLPTRKLDAVALDLDAPRSTNEERPLAIPVVPMQAGALTAWARLVLGMRNGRAIGYRFTSATAGPASNAVADESLDAVARVRRFVDASSAIARRLAVHMAAVPLTEPVMRLVRQEIVPEAREEHLVEVLFSGLVAQRIPDLWTATVGEELFDFHPGVRELLLESMSDAKIETIARAIGAYLERMQGAAYNFAATLDTPGKQGDAASRPFATVSAALVQTLHGSSAPATIDDSSAAPAAANAPLESNRDGSSNITTYGSGAYGSDAYGSGAYGSGAYGSGEYGSGAFEPSAFDSGSFFVSEMTSRAQEMDQQATQLFAQGEHEQGLATLREVVDLYRTLASSNPDAFQPRLAASLNGLGVNECKLGHHDLALAALRESVDLFSALAARNPDAFQPGLVTSLNDLRNQLSVMGQHEQALATSTELVDLHRALATRNPDAFQPGLATNLNNLANRLAQLGKYQLAHAAAHEAVDLYRTLATRNPDAFQHHLAMSLSNLGNRLAELGQREQALTTSLEAADLYRTLVVRDPDTFQPDLAMILNNLGNRLAELGQHEQALATSREAVDLCRALAKRNPDAFRLELAMALSNLSNRLHVLGLPQAAAETARESVELYRVLAMHSPSSYQTDLASSLYNLALKLSDWGQHEEAIAAASESVDIRRTQAANNPEAFEPALAMTLNILGDIFGKQGQLEKALEAAFEAGELYRSLAASTPNAFQAELALSLQNLSNLLAKLGWFEEAFASSNEAVEISRALEARDPSTFHSALTNSLRNHERMLTLRAREARTNEKRATAATSLQKLLALRTRDAQTKAEPPSIDVLIIVTLEDELVGVFAEGGGAESWQRRPDHVFVRSLPNESGELLGVAVASSGAMGARSTVQLASLVQQFQPSCLAMCGICAGRRGAVSLGDVIVADRVFSIDYGKLVAEEGGKAPQFIPDSQVYNLEPMWRLAAASFLHDLAWATHILPLRPSTKETQARWLLRALYAHEHKGAPAPLRHPERATVFRTAVPGATDWADCIRELRMMKLLASDPGVLALSDAGRLQVEEDHLLYPDDAPSDPPFRVHVGPIATSSTVIHDPEIFNQLRRFDRKILGLDLEAAGIGIAGHRWSLRTIIVKAVVDYADHGKDDRFREFACHASAAYLLAFLKKHLTPKSPGSEASGRKASLDNQSRSPMDASAKMDILVSAQVTAERASNMDRLRAARAAGQRVEILRHIGAASGTLSVARENAQHASERNARGERVARIVDAQGEREFECGVSANEVQELLSLGAIEK